MKKAKLDILEDISGMEIDLPVVQAEPAEVEDPPVAAGRKWAFNKLLFIGAPVLLIFLIISGGLIYFMTKVFAPPVVSMPAVVSQDGPKATDAHRVAETVTEDLVKNNSAGYAVALAPEALKVVYFKNFLIDIKDANGSYRVLMCEVAFDVRGEQKQQKLENNADARQIIYRAAQTRSAVALRSAAERKKLKKELVQELDKLLGEGSVKDVYFTNYLIM